MKLSKTRVLTIATALLAALSYNYFSSSPTIQDTTVMITNLSSTSGGSGTIVQTSATESKVITNAHVCGVVKNGGLVHAMTGTYFVTEYRVSEIHDLCLISVSADLHHSAEVASTPPATFDVETVAGHPRLLPTLLTKGHFSSKLVVQVMVGQRACTEAELNSPDTAIFCMILGALPLVKSYESIVVSSTIQPGSSGSGIYNSKNQLSGVIFAGSGEFGYGLAVPQEYVYNFLTVESKTLPSNKVDSTLKFATDNSGRDRHLKEIVLTICGLSDRLSEVEQQICSELKSSLLISDLIMK